MQWSGSYMGKLQFGPDPFINVLFTCLNDCDNDYTKMLVSLEGQFFHFVCHISEACVVGLALNVSSDDTHAQKPPKLRTKHHKGSSIKSLSRSHSSDSQSKGSGLSSRNNMKVDLSKLETTALWRYWRHFNLVDASPNPSKEQLIEVVQRHFMAQQLDELQVIVGFVQAAKRLKTICN
ncbi:unnamed protein product [Musa banksii]